MNSLFAVTLQALAPLFGLIALGYLLKRVRVLHVAHAPVLNGLVVNATLPALVLHSLLHAPAIPPRDVLLPFLLIAAEVVLVILVAVAARALRWPPPLAAAAILVASFGNSNHDTPVARNEVTKAGSTVPRDTVPSSTSSVNSAPPRGTL